MLNAKCLNVTYLRVKSPLQCSPILQKCANITRKKKCEARRISFFSFFVALYLKKICYVFVFQGRFEVFFETMFLF